MFGKRGVTSYWTQGAHSLGCPDRRRLLRLTLRPTGDTPVLASDPRLHTWFPHCVGEAVKIKSHRPTAGGNGIQPASWRAAGHGREDGNVGISCYDSTSRNLFYKYLYLWQKMQAGRLLPVLRGLGRARGILRTLLSWCRTLPGWSEQAEAALGAGGTGGRGWQGSAGCGDAASPRGSTMSRQHLWPPAMGRAPGGQNWGRDKDVAFAARYFVALDVCTRCNYCLYNGSQNVVRTCPKTHLRGS